MPKPQPAFISYRYTGEAHEDLVAMTDALCAILREKGYDPYSTMHDEAKFKEWGFTTGKITVHAMRHLVASKLLLAVVKTEEKSEGMLLEIGAVLGLLAGTFKKIPIVLAVRQGVKTTSLRSLVDEGIIDLLIEFDTMEDLYEQLRAAKMPAV